MCFELFKITLKREKKFERDKHQNDINCKNIWLEHNYFFKTRFHDYFSVIHFYSCASKKFNEEL